MLYEVFRISVMITALLGMIHMISTDSYTYVYFPVMILIWGIYTFFKESDDEFLRRNGYDYDAPYFAGRNSSYNAYNRKSATYEHYEPYKPTHRTYQSASSYLSAQYKGIVKKCKRNFNITIAKNGEI